MTMVNSPRGLVKCARASEGEPRKHLFVQLGKLSTYRDLHVGGYRSDVVQRGVNPVRSLEGDGSSPLVDHRG